MFVDCDSNKVYKEIGVDNKRGNKRDGNKIFEKVVYRDERGRYYTSNPWRINHNRTPPPHLADDEITSKTIGKTILPTSCQNHAAPTITKTIGKIIWLREMLMLKGNVKVVPSKILIQAKQSKSIN